MNERLDEDWREVVAGCKTCDGTGMLTIDEEWDEEDDDGGSGMITVTPCPDCMRRAHALREN